MAVYTNDLTNDIFAVLVPLTGESMAKNILTAQLKKLGLSEESLQTSDLSLLTDELRTVLMTFVGSEVADKVAEKLKTLK